MARRRLKSTPCIVVEETLVLHSPRLYDGATVDSKGEIMLDESNFIAQKDPENLLGMVLDSPAQLQHQFTMAGGELPQKETIDAIVIAGMGGSALAAEYLKVWPGLNVPLIICRNYSLPLFVNEHTLVIASSYSGNTEETLSALEEARQKKAHIVVTAHGGKLKEIAANDNHPFLEIPECVQPRVAAFYGLKALAVVLEKIGFCPGAVAELEATGQKIADVGARWKPDVPTAQNPAKQLAEEIVGKTPIIYAGVLFGAAYKWKISFNENAKNTAWCNQLPEFNHNEFIGWSSHPIDKPFVVINLLSTFDHPRVQKRFTISDKLLSGMRPESINIQVEGDTLLEQLLWADIFGSLISAYAGILNGVNPAPVELVEKFKKEMD